jgi:hypothetical protein
MIYDFNIIYLIFDNHSAVFLEFTELLDVQAFFDHFKIAAELPEEAHKDDTLSLEHQHPVAAGKEPLKNLLQALFV